MFDFSPTSLPRILIYVIAASIIGGSLFYSNYLVEELSVREKYRIDLFKDAYEIITSEDDEACENCPAASDFLQFVFNKIVMDSISQIPRLLVNEQGNVIDQNLVPDEIAMEDENQALLEKKRIEFGKSFEPIPVEYQGSFSQSIYYGESNLLKAIRWFPYIQLAVLMAFIGLVFYGFAIAKRNEQNRVWVGMAKETAHQLGTPVSSLMAWVELLRMKEKDRPEDKGLVDEMEQDVKRLENIAERFSKIGSKPELLPISLKEVLDTSASYIQKRMTTRGKIKLNINNQIPLESTLYINPQLFSWVIENLLKNALDATQQGSISLEAGAKGNNYFIDVRDTGKGIPKGNFKKVFEPGFTTKKRGWGLGLSLTKRIVENYHQGRIFVKSSEVGKGTTFRILLPKTFKG
ncbi:MAG: HAMP domain-containing sensor histidine kinase [Bacteroidota bacterium]